MRDDAEGVNVLSVANQLSVEMAAEGLDHAVESIFRRGIDVRVRAAQVQNVDNRIGSVEQTGYCTKAQFEVGSAQRCNRSPILQQDLGRSLIRLELLQFCELYLHAEMP